MGLVVERPKGAPMDVLELEYCSALRQTDLWRNDLRSNGSITAEDIRLHILSRHGVQVSIETIEQEILVHLAGGQEYTVEKMIVAVHDGDDEDDNVQGELKSVPFGTSTAAGLNDGDEQEVVTERRVTPLDMVQQVAVLMIPELKKLAVSKMLEGDDDDDDDEDEEEEENDFKNNELNEDDLDDLNNGTVSGATKTTKNRPYFDTAIDLDDYVPLSTATITTTTTTPAMPPKKKRVTLSPSLTNAQGDADGDADGNSNPPRSVRRDVLRQSKSAGTTPAAASSSSANNLRRRNTSNKWTASVRKILHLDDEPPPLKTVEPTLVDAVLLVILETSGLVYGDDLTVEAIQQMLLCFGEGHWPEDVIQQMLIQATASAEGIQHLERSDNDTSTTTNNNGRAVLPKQPKLNASTFLRALTVDLDLYDERVEDRTTTHFTDVNSDTSKKAMTENNNNNNNKTTMTTTTTTETTSSSTSPLLKRIFTASSIDYTADTYASFSWAIFVWFSLVLFFFSYIFQYLKQGVFVVQCHAADAHSFGCTVANAIVLWLQVMFRLCVMGFVFVALAMLGNSVYLTTHKWFGPLAMIISIATGVLTTIVAYVADIQTPFLETYKMDGMQTLYITTLVVGCLLLALQVLSLMRLLLLQTRGKATLPRLLDFAASSACTLERVTKEAASFKVRRMMEHALACHRFSTSSHSATTGGGALNNDNFQHQDRLYQAKNGRRLVGLNIDGRIAHALYHYQEKFMEKEKIGGFLWTARSLLSSLSSSSSSSSSSRGKNITSNKKKKNQASHVLAREEGVWIFPRLLWCNLGQFFVLGAIIYVWVIFAQSDYELDGVGITVMQLQAVIASGAVAALIACSVTTIRYIPSAVSTVLRFRHGELGSLRDRRFRPYRFAQDTSTYLFGSCIWGLACTGAICWLLISFLALGFALEWTRPFFLVLLAQIIGITTTMLLRILVFQILRFRWFRAFYRKRPAFANVLMVVSECWNVGISSGYILVRTLKLMLLAVFYIGRLDTPFLANGVGWIFDDIPLDNYPLAFRKDILIHEAHRHPYMERWAFLYLLKVRQGPKFGTVAGAAWRILFTLALMPWLRKYRVYPKVRTSWSTTHNTTSFNSYGMSFEDIIFRNQKLEYEVAMLREDLKESQAETRMRTRPRLNSIHV